MTAPILKQPAGSLTDLTTDMSVFSCVVQTPPTAVFVKSVLTDASDSQLTEQSSTILYNDSYYSDTNARLS